MPDAGTERAVESSSPRPFAHGVDARGRRDGAECDRESEYPYTQPSNEAEQAGQMGFRGSATTAR